jgi:ribose transport system substrate-binding protein
VPAIGSDNELSCRLIAAKKSGAGFQYFTLDGTTSYIRFAARRAIAAYQGTSDSESPAILPFPFADSAKGLAPKCDPAAPPDADLSSPLSAEKLKAIFLP